MRSDARKARRAAAGAGAAVRGAGGAVSGAQRVVAGGGGAAAAPAVAPADDWIWRHYRQAAAAARDTSKARRGTWSRKGPRGGWSWDDYRNCAAEAAAGDRKLAVETQESGPQAPASPVQPGGGGVAAAAAPASVEQQIVPPEDKAAERARRRKERLAKQNAEYRKPAAEAPPAPAERLPMRQARRMLRAGGRLATIARAVGLTVAEIAVLERGA